MKPTEQIMWGLMLPPTIKKKKTGKANTMLFPSLILYHFIIYSAFRVLANTAQEIVKLIYKNVLLSYFFKEQIAIYIYRG